MKLSLIAFFLIFFCSVFYFSACSKGVGCPTKSFTTSMKTKNHGKSNLFAPDMRKRAGN